MMLEGREAFISSIRKMEKIKKTSKKNAWRKLEVPTEAAMPCKKGTKKRSSFQDTEAKSCESNKEAHESTRQRLESPLPKMTNTTLQAKGTTQWTTFLWYTNLFRCPKRWKFRMRKQQWTGNGRSSKRFQPGSWTKFKSKQKVIQEAQRDKKEVHFAALMDICHLKNAEIEPTFQTYKGRIVLRGDIVKDTLEPMQSLLNRARLRLKWQQQKKWMSLREYLSVMDKQLTPYQHTFR